MFLGPAPPDRKKPKQPLVAPTRTFGHFNVRLYGRIFTDFTVLTFLMKIQLKTTVNDYHRVRMTKT